MQEVVWWCVCGHAEQNHDLIDGSYGPTAYGHCLHDRCHCAKSQITLFRAV